MRVIFAAIVLCLSVQGQAYAADKSGNYAIWGKGMKSCYHYLKDRDADKDTSYKNYIMGYLTAYNAMTPETYSISKNMKLDEIMTWMDDYCDSQKMSGLELSLIEFIITHYENRSRVPPGGAGR